MQDHLVLRVILVIPLFLVHQDQMDLVEKKEEEDHLVLLAHQDYAYWYHR